MNTVKNKMRRIMKKMISMVITLAMLVQYLPVNWLQDVFAAGTKPVSVSFLNSGANLKPAGDGNYLMSTGNPMTMNVNLNPNWNTNEGYALNPKIKITLPWFYYDEKGILVSTPKPEEVYAKNPNVKFIGGIEAKAEQSGSWYTETPAADNGYVWGSDHPAGTQDGAFRRSSLEVSAAASVHFNTKTTFNITFQFFTLDENNSIPENASVPVSIGASYENFVDSSGNTSAGYSIIPGNKPKNGEDETDVRTINIINSNLEWETSVKPVSMPVLWDKYNYGVYEVDINNTSKDSKSSIDHYGFVLNVPSYTFNEQKGVLDQDMMAWKYNSSGQLEANSDISDNAKSGEFGGKYNEGGALIWDVTNKNMDNFDLDTFASANESEFKYSYVQSGEIGVRVGTSNDSNGSLTSGESRKYYIAVPYANNFGNALTQKVILTQTIYFGGRDLAWSKKEDATFELKKQNTSFTHKKYLIDNKDNHVQEKNVAIGKEFSYYLGGFRNTSNTPVFDAYTIDSLPDEFNVTSLAIELNDGEMLENWFKADETTKNVDLSSIIALKFTNKKDNSEKWITLNELGISVIKEGNKYKLENIDKKLEDYLEKHNDLEFARNIKFEFKHRIEINESFNGRIVVTGTGKYLLDYTNKLNTTFVQWSWSPYTTADSEGPHYVKTNKNVDTEATAVAKSERADPQITGYGVLHKDNNTDDINSSKNDAGEYYQPVSLADTNTAIRYSLGNNNESYMIPAEFTVSELLKAKDDTNKVFVGLKASSVYLSPDLVSNSKIKSITFTDVDGTEIIVGYDEIASYIKPDKSIKVPESLWENYDSKKPITRLSGIKINFEEFSGKVDNKNDRAYVEINGTPNSTGEYRFDGRFTTKYGDYPGLTGKVSENEVTSAAILVVQRINPTIEASAHYGNNQKNDVNDPQDAPNKSSKVDIQNPTYYQFKIGNASDSIAKNVNLTFDLMSVTDVSKDKSKPKIKGFDTEKLVIEKNYTESMTIKKIEFFEYGQTTDDTAKWSVSANKLSQYIDDDGNIVITKDAYENLKLKRIRYIRIVADEFKNNIKDDKLAVVKIYGNTDAYNNYYKDKRLEASLFFEPIGEFYNKEDTLKESAAFSVESRYLDIHNDVYQENVTSEKIDDKTNTDKGKQTLGIPYSRDFTYRVTSWNDGKSVLDDVKTEITLPPYDSDNGGYHTKSVVIYENLLQQYKNFNGDNTFDKVVFTQKSPLVTAIFVKPEITMTYDDDKHQLICGDQKYTAKNGKFTLSVDDVTENGNQLESITLYGRNFILSKDKENVKPYVEINGWSDIDIGKDNIITTTATNYLDGMEEDANADYRITSNDTANAYHSKLYYDTTIVAGYNDNDSTERFTRVSTPREHVRNYGPETRDNSELEIGYKGLGSYSVDFRQYLQVGSEKIDSGMYSQDHGGMSYIKPTSFNTAANIKMDVDLPSDKFDAYYLRINNRVKNYIKQIVVTRQNGDQYIINSKDLEKRFNASSTDYGRINLLQSGENFTKDDNMLSDEKTDYYKSPKSSYTANNPIVKATIELKINQSATKEENGETVANIPDYGTWWDDSVDDTKYMFEFAGRFYDTGNAKASVSSTVTIGGEENGGNTSSKIRTSEGSSSANRGTNDWSYKNRYEYWTYSGGWGTDYYKADHLYSENYVIVVRDYDRISKGATTNATNDYNIKAEIGSDNQYYINFFRKTRCDVYDGRYRNEDMYESGSGPWYYQDPDDWDNKVSYSDHVDIVDTLGLIQNDPTYEYEGTLTTGLKFHKEIVNYFKDNDAIELTLGKGKTSTEQHQASNQTIITLKKSDLKQDGDYYTIDFDNSNDKASDDGTKLELKNGILHLEKYQYVLKFKAKLYDIQGNGEYNSEVKDEYYHYKDANGQVQKGVDQFNLTDKDIVVKVVPYMVYENNQTKIDQATNTATTQTYLDPRPDNANENIMDGSSRKPRKDSAYIMGYRIRFYAGYAIDSLGASPIDTKAAVSEDPDTNKRNITEYITDTNGNTYDMINNKKHKVTQNKTPTNAQFGVKIFNQYVADTSNLENRPARIKKLTTTDTMNTYYRMRNLYIPTQWIYKENGTSGTKGTDNGQWFKLSKLTFNINGNKVTFTPENVDGEMVLKLAPGSALQVQEIKLNTKKTVNGQECYVINIEDFVRQNKKAGTSYLIHETNGLAQVKINNFNLTFAATNPNFKDGKSVMDNGQYLTSTKANNDEYSYFYDGTYVDRTLKDFEDDEWTNDSVPTFGKKGNDYSPSSNYTDTSNRDVSNRIDFNSISSVDNNADTFHVTNNSKATDYYRLRNAVAILTPNLTKERTLADGNKVFAYDKDSNEETNKNFNPKQLEVDQNHLMPYDYVEYTLTSGNHSAAELPLERNHMTFTVGEGQQIVGWELISAEGIKNGNTQDTITDKDISAKLTGDDSSETLDNVKAKKDYSIKKNSDGTKEDSRYRTIKFVVGDEGTQMKPGQSIKIRIITQLVDDFTNSKDDDTFEGKTVNAHAYIYAENKHSYGQYAIDGYDQTKYVTGTTGSTYPHYYCSNSADDQKIEGPIYYYRYHDSDNYTSRVDSNVKFYNNTALGITYNFDHNDREFDSQGATLNISNIKNDTMHFIDKQTVTVNFLEYKNNTTYQGFILDKIPTVSKTSAGKGDIYYPDQFITQVGGEDKVDNILVEYTKDDPNTSDAKWTTASYKESISDIHEIKGIRWTYFNVPSGYHSDTNVYSEEIKFADVTLKGQAHYEDIRTNTDKQNKKQRNDIYNSHDTATISHYKDHSETKDVMIGDSEEKDYVVNRDVTLNEVKEATKGVYRESPQVILHPQVFDESNSGIATEAYDPTNTHDDQQKIGYRPNETYWQKISLVNQEMLDSSGTQNNRQGRLIDPTIYDKIPEDYVTVEEDSLNFKWTDKNGNDIQGNYHIVPAVVEKNANQYDYGGKMIYRKSTSVKKSWKRIYGTDGMKAFDDLDTSEDYTLKTNYTVKTYRILDENNKPITMELGDRLTIYYKLKAKEDNLPMVYVDEDRDVTTKNDQHPAYFPRVGEYYQYSEDGYWGYYGYAYPFSYQSGSIADDTHYRAIQNSNIQMDMDYLLHDVGVSGKPNNDPNDESIKRDNIDNWEFLKDSIVYIPGDGSHIGEYENQRYGGGNNTLADYDISSAYYSQKTSYVPVQGDPDDTLPNYGDDKTKATSLKGSDKIERDWYEKVVKKRTIANKKYNSSENENWGSSAPIVWGENRLHLQKAWLVSASEFMDATLQADGTLKDNDPNKEHRTYEATTGDGLGTDRASNPNYYVYDNYYTYSHTRNEVHSLVDDNYEVGLEYNEEFTTKLQALNYGDWDLSRGVEFTYTMPRGIEPLIFAKDGTTIDKNKLKAEILKSVSGVNVRNNNNIRTEEVNESYDTISVDDIDIEVLQKPDSGSYSYQAPSTCQDPQFKDSEKSDYETGNDTSPWVLKITVKKNLQKWFNRHSESGYKLNVYIPSKVVCTNEDEEWFDRLQTKPCADNEDYYYYQILDYDHFEGTTKENMKNNQRFGMDYMWYRGDGYGWNGNFFTNPNYYYYNGSPNTPYVDGYNIQNQEVTISEKNGIKTAKATNNDADYGDANCIDRYSQTGTRAVMRKPLLRQWTTTGKDDTTGQSLSDYYLDTEGTTSKLNIHVENKYYWDSLGTNYERYYNDGVNYAECTKEKHSYAIDGGGRGTYSLPVITNILPYGIAPVGTDSANKSDIYSTNNSQNDSRTLNWKLLDLDGNELTNEQNSYDVKVTYEKIVRKTSAGEVVRDENGKAVTEGRYVVRFYPKKGADTKIVSGEGRTFSFDTFVYSSPKVNTKFGDNKDLQDTYETNYTYLSSTIHGFKALTDESIEENPYTVGSNAYNLYFDTNKNSNGEYVSLDDRHDAIQITDVINKQKRVYGKIPNRIIKDKVTDETHYVIGQGMKEVFENEDTYNLEDYTKQKIDGIDQVIRDNLMLSEKQRDFNMNNSNVHEDYTKDDYTHVNSNIPDRAYVNTIKIRTRQPNLTVENFVSSTSDDEGKNTPCKDSDGNDVQAGSVEYTDKKFDYGDDVWYSAKLANKADSTDYAHQGSVAHSRFVFSFHLPKAVSVTDLPDFNTASDHWDQFRDDDFVIEIEHADGSKTSVTPSQLKDSGFGIRIINKQYRPTSPTKNHTGQIVTYEVTTPKTDEFSDYSSFVNGEKPAGYLASGDTLILKIRTRIDNKEETGIDPSDKNSVDVWTGYYSEVYSTLHTSNGEYIVTNDGNIYDKKDGNIYDSQGKKVNISNSDINYDGYSFNEASIISHEKSFTKQLNMTWLDKEVSDSNDKTEEDGSITKGNDYDQDGDLNEDFAYSSSASISILKPKATTRIDTSQLRKQVNDLDAEVAVIDDAHVKSSDLMYMRLTEAVNNSAKLNQFVTSMSIPYRGTDTATSKPATMNDTEMETEIQEIRTGSWEIPKDIENYDLYKSYLKVYMYAYLVDDPWKESGVINPNENLQNWVLIGNKDGYALEENAKISQTDVPAGKYIYQLNWVVKMEGFTDDTGKRYSESNAAINYPVPVGLRLNTTGKDNKGVDQLDPDRENISKDIMHDDGVVNNCAYVSVITGPKNSSDGIAKHVNYFATTYGKYDDYKYSSISTRCRAGFYIDPELPTLEIELDQAYYRATLKKDASGKHKSYYSWDYNNTLIDDTTSKVLKYRVSMNNKKKNKDQGITDEDNATNPNITVALPYDENLDTNKLKYVSFDRNASSSVQPSDYLNDYYTSIDEGLDSKAPLWTWYIVNEDGSIADPSPVKPIQATDETPLVKMKSIAASRKEKNKILNFYFTGQLKPGQSLKVEIMVPVERMNSNAISAELLRCKGYIFKKGAFRTYMPDQGNSNASAYEYDSQDVNENKRYNDAALTKMTAAIGFSQTEALGQSKLVDTELEPNVTSRPAAVNEGGDYTFKVSSTSLSDTSAYKYTNNVIYDVLPYDNDYYAYQINDDNKVKRNSKWNGWLNLDSIKLKDVTNGNETTVENDQYDIWVGPIVNENDKCVLKTNDDGSPCLPNPNDLKNEQYAQTIASNDDTEKQKYFVKLSDLKAYLQSVDEDEQEKLTKGIRAIWLQMKDEYTIQPAGRLEMSYTMHAPQNVKKYVGNVKVDSSSNTSTNAQISAAVKDIVGWNSFLSRAYSLANSKYENDESAIAGVYIDAPSERGYIGSYVWQDVNYDGKVNEGTYEDTHGIGRKLLKDGTAKYDLDGDGKKDDPGIDGVKVELLTEHGRPANKEGDAIRIDDKGRYVLVDDETGKDLLADEGSSTERPRYSTSGPATYTTEKDYYGNKGYFVFSNLKPDKYNLRYTLPDEYKDYSITTKELNTDNASTPVVIYRDGKAVYDKQNQASAQQKAYAVKEGTLVAQTAQSIQVDAVVEDEGHQAYDEKAMGYNLGVGRTNLYKGTTWLDETEENGEYIIEGQMDYPKAEKRLGKIKVEAYEVDPKTSKPISDEPATDADGNKASYVTNVQDGGDLKAGEYQFRLVPGKTYIIKATNENATPLKATAPIYSQDPTKDTGYNDLLLRGGKLITNQFDVPYIVGDKIAGWENYSDEHTIDLGFVNAARGFIGELVWDDKDYDGIQNPDEDPLKDVTVTLEQYYYKDSKWHKLPDTKDVQTNAAGAYKFTVSTYYEDGNNSYLAGYKVRIDRDKNNDLFKKYAPTFKDKETNGKQSDLDETSKNNNYYYLTDDVVVIASEVGDTTQVGNSVECGGIHYDLGNAETKNFDAGFKDYESGKIDGIVWLDANYDGIRDTNEKIADKDNLTDNEKLLEKIKAQIKGYYYDDGKWHDASASGAKVQWTVDDVKLKLADDGYYHYTFKNLPTELQDNNGNTYLMGYKVTLDEKSIDKTLKPTLSYQTTSDQDSDLVKRSGNYALMKKDDYVITAKKLSDTDDKHKGTLKTVGDNTYDLLQHQNINNYDAGLTGIETSAISGQVWIDQNYDGIQNTYEKSLKGIKVKLVRYLVTKVDGKLNYVKDNTYTEPIVTTSDKGRYRFDNLEDSPNNDSELYAYQVVIDPNDADNKTILEDENTRLGITKYHQGDNDKKDSDWSNDGTLIDNSGKYLILLNKANDNTPDENNVLGYDIVKGKAYEDVNAGATPYQNAKILGNIFDDKDYDGLNTKDDEGKENVEVNLNRYLVTKDSDGKFVYNEDQSFKEQTTLTNAKGDYSFDDLPTNGYVTDPNDPTKRTQVIYAYAVSVKGLPSDYVVTKYHKGKDDARDSNIDPQDSQYTLKDKSGNPYIILAKKSDDDKLAQYLDGYDLIENKNKDNYDGGITKYHSGIISGTIFDDKDYNGLLGKDDKGYQGINVILSQYQKVGDEYFLTGMIDSVETDENGKYTFSNIATYGTNEEGERVLYAYRVTLDEDSLPEGYGVTRYRVNDKDESSKLSSKDYELITNKENQFKDSTEPYIIMAEKTDDDSIPYNIEGYDIVGNNSIKHLNGGITRIQTGSISGKIFNDDDYDGLSTKDDKGFEGIEISLKQYYLKDNEYVLTDKEFTCKTTSDGSYKFDQLPTNGIENDEHVIYYYKAFVKIDTLPSGYAITKYHVGKDDTKDSDLLSESGELLGKDQYMVLVDKADKDNVQSIVNGYDIITAKDIKYLDGGLTSYNQGTIEGTLWIDANRNGIIDKNESYLSHQKMILKGYYYKDNQWIEESSLDSEVETDENGKYNFSHLATTITKDEQTYLTGYQVSLDALPKDKKITEYLKNNGKDDSKLKDEDLRLIYTQYEKDGYLIVAGRFDEDNINNQSSNYEGYNAIKAIDIKDMNAGFYDPDKPVMTGNPIIQLLQRIKTGDNVSIMGYVLLGLISCGIIVLIVFKKRKDNE